jgi:hypothetical protein
MAGTSGCVLLLWHVSLAVAACHVIAQGQERRQNGWTFNLINVRFDKRIYVYTLILVAHCSLKLPI